MNSTQERYTPSGWYPAGYHIVAHETGGQSATRRWAAVYPDGTEGPQRIRHADALADCQLHAIKNG